MWIYPMVNIEKTDGKDPPFSMGKSTFFYFDWAIFQFANCWFTRGYVDLHHWLNWQTFILYGEAMTGAKRRE